MSTNWTHASMSRPAIKTNTTESEEAGQTLRLGEFQNTRTLSLSEARLVLEAIVAFRRSGTNPSRYPETEVLKQMQEYLDTFARFKRKETAEEIGSILDQYPQLVDFEKSQLKTLCCESYDEAKTLIPSLGGKIGDVELAELLAQISSRRNFAE